MKQGVIKFVRLVSGEDLVVQVLLEEGIAMGQNYSKKTFIDPFKIVYTMQPGTGRLTPYLMRWVFSKFVDRQEFSIPQAQILLEENASELMKRYYLDNLNEITKDKAEDKEESEIGNLKQLLNENGGSDNIKKHLQALAEPLERKNLDHE